MAAVFQIHILAADHTVYEGECESLTVPTTYGEQGILAHHSDMIAAVETGELRYTVAGEKPQIIAVSQGLMKVEKGEVLVLVDTADRPDEIDINRAKRAADAAKEEMLRKKSHQEFLSALAHLARAINRMRVKRHNREI